MSEVWVAHAAEDRPFAARLIADLRAAGQDVASLADSIGPGESIAAHIASALGRADALVVVLSRAAAASAWVSTEVALALSRQQREGSIRILPVLAEPGAPVPPLLADRLYIDLSNHSAYRRGLPLIVQALREPAFEQAMREELDTSRAELLAASRHALDAAQHAYSIELAGRSQVLSSSIATVAILAALVAGLVVLVPSFRDSTGTLVSISLATGVAASILGTLVSKLISIRARSGRTEKGDQ